MEEKQKLKRNVWKYYLFSILGSLFFPLPIIVLFWQNNGLSLTQIMILQSLFAIAIVVLEVPTGYFADIFGRRTTLINSAIFLTLGVIVYSIGHNFAQFLIAEILWAVGVSLNSGTGAAFVYDTLKDLGREKSYKKIWGKTIGYGFVAMAFASVLGGLIGKIGFRSTFYATLPCLALLIPLAFSMKEPKRHKRIFERGYMYELLKILKFSLVENKKIRWLIIYSGVVLAFNSAVLWLYQPYFTLSGLDIVHFGVVFASFQIVAAISSKYAHKIEEKLGQKRSLIMLVVLVGVSYLLMSNFVYLFSFSFAFLQQFVRGFSEPVITDYINKLTSSDIRATVLSAQNLSSALMYACIIPFIGWIADVYSIVQALTVLGITIFVVGTGLLLILHKGKVI